MTVTEQTSLLVGGTEEDVKAIRGLVAQFDTAKVQVTRDIERIELIREA